jgi:hypothetical protein
MSKEWLEKILRNEYRRQSGKTNSIKLPENISYEPDGDCLCLRLNRKCVTNNMQKDEAAFEGWGLAFKYFLAKEYKNIVLRWEPPNDNCTKKEYQHYQKFLYRVIKFKELFPSWFSVESSKANLINFCIAPYEKCHVQDNRRFVLNAPTKCRMDKPQGKSNSEHYIECMFRGTWRSCLTQAVGIKEESIDSQLPVGLFYGEINKDCAIFPRQKSAIDLWAVYDSSLHIFELKTKRNSKVGIISELFCYTMMMEDACQKIFTWPKDGKGRLSPRQLIGSGNIKKIHAHFLSPSLHPLIVPGMIDLLNKSLCDIKPNIQFDFLQYSENNNGDPIIKKMKVW